MSRVIYVSEDVVCYAVYGKLILRSRSGASVEIPAKKPRDPDEWGNRIMLELTEDQRITLGLPDCGARTGGTALCLLRGGIPGEVPRAPRTFEERIEAELWPLQDLPVIFYPTPKGEA